VGGAPPTPEERAGLAGRVEMYKCNEVGSVAVVTNLLLCYYVFMLVMTIVVFVGGKFIISVWSNNTISKVQSSRKTLRDTTVRHRLRYIGLAVKFVVDNIICHLWGVHQGEVWRMG